MTEKIQCPGCGAVELYLIGAVVRGQDGVVYNGEFNLATIGLINPVVQHGLLLCRTCKRQWTTHEVNEFNDILQSQILWETNYNGLKVPIVCPVCKNTKDFIRTIQIRYEVDQEVKISNGEIVSTIPEQPQYDWDLMADRQKITVVQYNCDVDDCAGYITLIPIT